jgi:transcription elongation GreA/GreB family factor
MKLFVTREYFSDAENRIRELNVTLDKIRADKTAAYTQDTNSWHDNFAYEHLTREEKQTERHLSDLITEFQNMEIVPLCAQFNADCVGLYCTVTVSQENLNTGAITQNSFSIVPLGGEDITNKIYAYNMPIVSPLMGLSVGGQANVAMPSGELEITILSIYPFNSGGNK